LNQDSIIAKARGAFRLASEGKTRGERAAAQSALDRILEKYDLSEADLIVRPDLDWYAFRHTTHWEKRLIYQLHHKVTEGRDEDGKCFENDKIVEVQMTPDEYEKMVRYFYAYMQAWRDAVESLFYAFIQRHELFAKGCGKTTEYSASEMRRMASMARGLGRVLVPSALGRRIEK
jgi:hypothetical protein